MRRFLLSLFLLSLISSISPLLAECEPDDFACQIESKVESGEGTPALNPDKVDEKTHKQCQKIKESTKCEKKEGCYWDSTVKGGKCKGNGYN
ncbi:hypothetical protein [Leptospira idonii]|uniref:Uncharacterized protein n=1 Tax=Leptospira idonii TaxID=1193500 RepID=A0A4R9LY55_9LEPT|nr:hypothetical protein [Leptospira idonii]TGN19284.1 hypothetical protein EHS15_09280 [Leptospira idonii]